MTKSFNIPHSETSKWPLIFNTKEDSLKNSLLIGLHKAMGTTYDPQKCCFWQKGDSVALNTGERYPVVLSVWSMEDGRQLADEIFKNKINFDGFVGPEPTVSQIANAYAQFENKTLDRHEQSMFMCIAVDFPDVRPQGHIKQATADDCDLIAKWTLAFEAEALPNKISATFAEAREFAEKKISSGHFYLWMLNAESPVTMAAFTGLTDISTRIAAVYTPPEHRKHGYASQLVAEMTQLILNDKKIATLYTDKLNPTSNKIYQCIGYKFMEDSAHIRFR